MEKTDETSAVKLFHKLVRYGFFICGLPTGEFRKSVKRSYYGVAFIMHTFLILGSIITSINTPTSLFKLQVATRLLFSSSMVLVFAFMHLYKIQLLQIYSKFDQNLKSRRPNEYVGDDETKITAKTFIPAAQKDLAVYCAVMTTGLVMGILGQLHGQDMYDFMYLYQCGPSDKSPRIRFCISEGDFSHFIINEILAFVFITYESMIAQVAQLLLIAALKGVDSMILRYDELVLVAVEQVKKMRKSDKGDYLQLKELIKYQQLVIRHIQPIKSNLHIGIVVHVIAFYVLVIFIAVPIASQAVKPIYLNIIFVALVSYITYIHYTVCNNWQTINVAQQHFCDTLSEFPWYERNLQFQKLYLMTLQLNQRCDPFTIFGLYVVNLKFFAANMNRLYTMVNVLLLKFKL